ncbi:hypothetical protein B0T16DRAFT_454747 [Cercophora newfieldiana]|uniref:Uncharacterized protein n=1 Tax=Cercophora newfieldiana TaxID=92897 RepID=A0AA39YI47_9PEZI|nr:hypothetical protein B0T16DRAFT_454747 [Cercophora newfieldiana]
MLSEWATHQRARIVQNNLHNTGQPTPPTSYEEFSIDTLSTLSTSDAPTLTTAITSWLTSTGPEAAPDVWYAFHSALLSLAQFTSSPAIHQKLASLTVSLAQTTTSAPGTTELLTTLHGFGWAVRDLWNGPKALADDSLRSWVNLNRFMAYLSLQNRATPVEALSGWVEDFGMWTIADGLEERNGVRDHHAEAAACWLEVAGGEIWKDARWGGRDQNGREGELWTRKSAEEALGYEERWAFWRERLERIAKDEAVEEGVREAARRAGEVMAGCEENEG